MTLHVEISSITQKLDLQKGRTTNYLELQFPDGWRLSLPIPDAQLEEVVRRASMVTLPAEEQESLAAPSSDLHFGENVELPAGTKEDPDQMATFGGDVPEAPPAPQPLPSTVAPPRRRKPEVNSQGYPIMTVEPGTMDTRAVLGNEGSKDEDGVSSL